MSFTFGPTLYRSKPNNYRVVGIYTVRTIAEYPGFELAPIGFVVMAPNGEIMWRAENAAACCDRADQIEAEIAAANRTPEPGGYGQ